MPSSRILERATTPRGEFVLREDDGTLLLMANGLFLMDGEAGASERALVESAVTRAGADVLIGGLGLGRSIGAALDAGAGSVTVLEHEPLVLEWCRRHLGPQDAARLADTRVTVVLEDVAAFVAGTQRRFDAICLDVDNGPDLLAHPGNRVLYSQAWLRTARGRLAQDGRLSVWSAGASPALEAELRAVFGVVETVEVAARRGPPDVIYVAAAG